MQEYIPMPFEDLMKIKKGDVVERMLAFQIPQYLNVEIVTDERIVAGPWEFDRETGLEIDEDIQDMSIPLMDRLQISYIKRVLTEEEKQKVQLQNINGLV